MYLEERLVQLFTTRINSQRAVNPDAGSLSPPALDEGAALVAAGTVDAVYAVFTLFTL
jgi:hypothetical protein